MVVDRPLVFDDALPPAEVMMQNLLNQVQAEVRQAEQSLSALFAIQEQELAHSVDDKQAGG